ncbi:hypothetical protein B0H14DRAFT_1314427 [Mycena olivaceomarginata]|nr:hypothetical protein B0H14DRAFT_1314427 [Mycena olivaceomarginata]
MPYHAHTLYTRLLHTPDTPHGRRCCSSACALPSLPPRARRRSSPGFDPSVFSARACVHRSWDVRHHCRVQRLYIRSPSHTPFSSPSAHGHCHTLPPRRLRLSCTICTTTRHAPRTSTRAQHPLPPFPIDRRRRTDRHQAHHSRLPPDSALSSRRLRLGASPAGPTPVPGARQVSRSPSRACHSLPLRSLRRPRHPSTLSLCPPLSRNMTRSNSIICEHQLPFACIAFVASPHAATFLVVS